MYHLHQRGARLFFVSNWTPVETLIRLSERCLARRADFILEDGHVVKNRYNGVTALPVERFTWRERCRVFFKGTL